MACGLGGDGIGGQDLELGRRGGGQGLAGQDAAAQGESDLPGHDETGAAGRVVLADQPAAFEKLGRTWRPAAGAQRAHGRPPGEGPQHSERGPGHLPRVGLELGERRRRGRRVRGRGPQAERVGAEDVHEARHGPGLDHEGESGQPLQPGRHVIGLQAERLRQDSGLLRSEGDDGLGDGQGGRIETRQGCLHAGAGTGAGRERGEGGRRRGGQVGAGGQERGDVDIGQGGDVGGEALHARPGGVVSASVPLSACGVVLLGPRAH